MLAIALSLLVAMATSDVNGQASHDYDIPDCRVYHMVGHHAENPADCRTFYNCDNTFGGKLVNCSDGTTYDRNQGLCTIGSSCPQWFNQTGCIINPQATRKFAGICCASYFDYSCASGSYTPRSCGFGQYFHEGRQSCMPGTPPNNMCSNACNDIDLPPGFCLMTHMTRVSNCTFKKKGSDIVMRCPDGTAFDDRLCMCVLDFDRRCPFQTESKGCNAKQRFNPANGLFEENPQGQSAPFSLTGKGTVLWRLQGQDFLYTPFAIRLSVTLQQQQTGDVAILTSESPCSGLKLDVRISRGNSLTVTLGVMNQIMTLNGNINPNGQLVILVFIDAQNKQFAAIANNQQLNGNVSPGMFATWNGQTACKLTVGPFTGTVNEVAYWRNCEMSQIPRF